MNKKILTRRDFLRTMGITTASAVLHGCAPTGTPFPSQGELPSAVAGPGTLRIVYPRKGTYGKGTKVTNPNLNFQWESTDQWFVLEVFTLKMSSDARNYFWDFAFSAQVNTTNYDVIQMNGAPLERDLRYYWQVTSYQSEVSLPSLDAYTLPSDFIVDESRPEDIPYPSRAKLEGETGFDSGQFFLKPWRNYLAAYLKRVPDASPVIPLLYYYMNRYKQSTCTDCGDCPSESICISFPKTTPVMRDIPPDLLEKILYNFADAGVSIPGVEDPGWMESQLRRLFAGTVIEGIRSYQDTIQKTIAVYIAGEIFCASSPNDPAALQVLSQSIFPNLMASGLISEGSEWLLTITGNAPTGGSITERLVLKTGSDGWYYLYPETYRLFGLDSATFTAVLRLPNGEEMTGSAVVRGGSPVILKIDPSDAEQGKSGIQIVMQNGGDGERITLSDPSSGFSVEIPISKVQQNLICQIYQFDLSGTDMNNTSYLILDGEYNIVYRNTEGSSSGEKPFRVRGQKYIVEVSQIICNDESNPEWWGDDSICFSTLINTEHFLQKPFTSQVYDGYSDGYASGNFNNGDDEIYHRSDPKIGTIDGRIIENYLSISMGIFEYDDWGWLGWIIDKIIDIVQSFLEDLIDMITFGVGGFIIEMGLEASGLNRMREEAINGLITGFEFELLCEGTTTTYVENGELVLPLLDMQGEAAYAVDFLLRRV